MAATQTLGTAESGRDASGLRFLCLLTAALALLGVGLAAGSLLGSLAPSAERWVTRTVDLSDIPVGERRTVYWKGYSIFIAHRTPEEIAIAREYDSHNNIKHFGIFDRDRVQREDWLVVLGGRSWCRLQGQNPGEERGDMGGWYDPCGGDSFDPSGRSKLLSDFAWSHLIIPPYRFISDSEIEFDACFPRRC